MTTEEALTGSHVLIERECEYCGGSGEIDLPEKERIVPCLHCGTTGRILERIPIDDFVDEVTRRQAYDAEQAKCHAEKADRDSYFATEEQAHDA